MLSTGQILFWVFVEHLSRQAQFPLATQNPVFAVFPAQFLRPCTVYVDLKEIGEAQNQMIGIAINPRILS